MIYMITDPNGVLVYFVALIISLFTKYILEKEDGEGFFTYTKNIFGKSNGNSGKNK